MQVESRREMFFRMDFVDLGLGDLLVLVNVPGYTPRGYVFFHGLKSSCALRFNRVNGELRPCGLQG